MKNQTIHLLLSLMLSACSYQGVEPVSGQKLTLKAGTLAPVLAARTTAQVTNGKKTCSMPDFVKQVTVGYQGWFAAKGDGVGNVWKHWSHYNKVPTKHNVMFELYPDVSGYNPEDLFDTELGKLGNGKSAKLFSSAREGVIDLHFKWMSDYGLDGIALQRFASDLNNKKNLKHNNTVARLVKHKAEKYCRTFYVMYDVSGYTGGDIVRKIKSDWLDTLDKKIHVTQSKHYARHNNKPVIGLWGLGFNTPAHPVNQKQALALINWFRNRGFYVVGGVPYNWRKEQLDSRKNWLQVYQRFDMLLPWSVGRYRDIEELMHHYRTIWRQDLTYANNHHIHMKRVIFPGFAWSNWKKGPRNEIPRRLGDLFWKQAYLTKRLGLGAYIAMFDEYDEGTAIAKAATDRSMIPEGRYFLTLSADGHDVSADYYLRLSGKITEMLHDGKYYGFTLPAIRR